MLRSSSFYGLWACYFIGCLAGLMAISIAKPVGTDVGIETGLATFLVGFFAIFNGGGRPAFGALTDRLTPRNTALLSFVLIALASLVMWQVPSCRCTSLPLPYSGDVSGAGWPLHRQPPAGILAPATTRGVTGSSSSRLVPVRLPGRSWQGSSRHRQGPISGYFRMCSSLPWSVFSLRSSS